ncbi:hypothetical protein NQ315_015642 [Exocentrus adspersus]|uniref:JmjC domain-containing protein n=1 Tax=Exocentrus adspersus TaxID=1586481 RepID=A0AAV8W3E3_9CUCU|nr:hypothetical protein NQ315_015642 [Exocentrus adspersus]
MDKKDHKNTVQLALDALYSETTGILNSYSFSADLIHTHLKLPEVHIEDYETWPLTFYRNYVSKNYPVLIKGAGKSLPAVQKWNPEYLNEVIPQKEVTVAVTPNGYADGVALISDKEYFVMPEEINIRYTDFLRFLDRQMENFVCYIQTQNSNLMEDFAELLPDVGSEIKWASQAFDKKPDAVNFWMGDERAVTSMHKDPYENIYCVIDGHKDFMLIPPTDLPYVPYKQYPVKKYKHITPTSFEIESVNGVNNIMWIAVDPLNRKKIFEFSCGTVLPQPVVTSQVSQYDVEENIAQLMTLARIALEKGDVERAEAILEMGIKICDEYQAYIAMPYMYDILASICIATGIPENDSQIVDFKLRLSRIYSSYDENVLAEIGFKKCLMMQEEKILDGDTSLKTGMLYINVLFWYGLHKIKTANYTSAKQLIDSAYSYSMKIRGLTPYQEMVILYTLADLNIQLEDYAIALQNIQSAILLGKGIGSLDLPRCYLKLGKIYIKLGSNEVAKHWLDEAYKLAELFNDREVFEEVEVIFSELSENNVSLK